jgi:hypothetical protein
VLCSRRFGELSVRELSVRIHHVRVADHLPTRALALAGLFSTFDCAVKGYRGKEDAWNAIISGFLVGGTLACRGA